MKSAVAATLIADGEELSEAVGDVKDGNGRGALHFAARGGHENICQYLVEELHLPVDPLDDEGKFLGAHGQQTLSDREV